MRARDPSERSLGVIFVGSSFDFTAAVRVVPCAPVLSSQAPEERNSERRLPFPGTEYLIAY